MHKDDKLVTELLLKQIGESIEEINNIEILQLKDHSTHETIITFTIDRNIATYKQKGVK